MGNGAMIELHCVHCDKVLTTRYFLNAWVMGYECNPICEPGRAWYTANTWRTAAGVMLRPEREADVRQQRRALCQAQTSST